MAEVASDQVATFIMIIMVVALGLILVEGFVLFHHASVHDKNWDAHLELLRKRWAEVVSGKIDGRKLESPKEIEAEKAKLRTELKALQAPPASVSDRLLDYSADFLVDAIARSDDARFAETVLYRTGIGRSFQETLVQLQTVIDNAFSYALGGVAVLIVNKYAVAQADTFGSLVSVFGGLLAVVAIFKITTGTLIAHIRMKMSSTGLGPDSVIPKARSEFEPRTMEREGLSTPIVAIPVAPETGT